MIRVITKTVLLLKGEGCRCWETLPNVSLTSAHIPRTAICVLLVHVSVVQRLKPGGFPETLPVYCSQMFSVTAL